MRKGLLSLFLAGLLWHALAQAPSYSLAADTTTPYAPGQLIVRFRPGLSDEARAMVRALVGVQQYTHNTWLDFEYWQVSPYADVPALCRQLLQTSWIEIADPNYRIELAWEPNDPRWNDQQALRVVRCPQGWDHWRGDANFIAGILDTGVLRTHPDLQARLLNGWDFGNDDNDPSDPFGHGTFVTGIAGAVTNNGVGIASLCPEGKILPIKVFTDAGQGYLQPLLDGVSYAVSQGAHVINLSLGSNTAMPALQTALQSAWNAGVVVVAAAGNNNNTNPFYPAWYPVCIAVAASNLDDTKSSVSTYGSWVDVAAPSGDVWSTTLSGGYGRNTNGYTSYAAPFVTAHALLLYPLVADSPSDRSMARAQAVRELIESTAVPVPGNYVAYGRINVEASILKALTVPVRGRIIIPGYLASYASRTVEVFVRPVGGGAPIASQTGNADSLGNFDIGVFLNPSQLGYRDLAIRATGTLLKRVPNVRMRYPGVSGLTLTLTLGDINGDNVIDDADLLAVLFAFGQSGANPADLNGDGVVDDADLLLVLFNFGQTGE